MTLTSPGIGHLESRVFEHPDDEHLRQVVADALLEQGDPRGEFIALQLAIARGGSTTEQRDRALTLEREHGARWSTIGSADQVEHRRGFPWLVRTRSLEPGPAWATVGVLVVTDSGPLGHFLASCTALQSLERIINVRAEHVDDCHAWRTPRLRALDLADGLSPDQATRLLRLSTLRELSLRAAEPAEVEWLWEHPLAHRLELVRLRVLFGPAVDLRALRTPAPFVTRVECLLGFSLEVDGSALVLRLRAREQLDDFFPTLKPTLRASLAAVCETLRIVDDAGPVPASGLPRSWKGLARFVTP
jgi:uncharacterized protein (TIGR02996 family)